MAKLGYTTTVDVTGELDGKQVVGKVKIVWHPPIVPASPDIDPPPSCKPRNSGESESGLGLGLWLLSFMGVALFIVAATTAVVWWVSGV